MFSKRDGDIQMEGLLEEVTQEVVRVEGKHALRIWRKCVFYILVLSFVFHSCCNK